MNNQVGNPYENYYRNLGFSINEEVSYEQAEDIARQLGLMYNAVGVVIKDITKLLSYKFTEKKSSENDKVFEKKAQIISHFLSSSEVDKQNIPNIQTIKTVSVNEKVQIHFDNKALNDPLSSQSGSNPQQEGENQALLGVYQARIDSIIRSNCRSYGKTAKKGSKTARQDFEQNSMNQNQNNVISLDD